MRCLHSIIAGRLSYQRHQRSSDPREVCDAALSIQEAALVQFLVLVVQLPLLGGDGGPNLQLMTSQ